MTESSEPVRNELRRAIHAVLLPGFSGTQVPDWLAQAEGLAGVLLFGQNTPDPHTTAQVATQLRAIHPDLLICIDEEGGNVSRLEPAGSSLPARAALGFLDDVALTRICAQAMGDLVAACGIDLTFAPVVDVAACPDNPVIGARAFGADPALVARHGVAVIEGLRAAGVLTGAKHFPGHGDTNVDSHVALPQVAVDEAVLRARDFPPFEAAIGAGVDSIMVGHLMVPALDLNRPASLSSSILALARDLGFTGPLVTDALDMKAVSADGVGAACVRALQAGADVLCLGSTAEIADDGAHFADVVATIEAAVVGGSLDLSRLTDAAQRVGALVRPQRTAAPAEVIDQAWHCVQQVGLDAARRAVQCQGDVRVRRGDVVVDQITRWDYAAGTAAGPIVAELMQRCGATAERSGPPGRLVVVAREVDQGLRDLLAENPDAVLVHVGVAAAAPEHRNIVFSHGTGLASARAAADVCRTGRTP